jgi:ABC-type branched-subunit amino acid transport system substrate-binding protein
MKKASLVLSMVISLIANHSFAQEDSTKMHRIAIFVPLYLDSAFDATGAYRFDKTLPRYISPGLEFYQGVHCALDSLEKDGLRFDIQVFDTRGSEGNISKVVHEEGFDSVQLIIGSVSGIEYLQLASVAKQKNIPFISATYPNDGGLTGNPYVVIVNSKLNTHLQTIYNFVLRNLSTHNMILVRRNNVQDDRVTDVFKSLNTTPSGNLMNYQTVTLNDEFTGNDLSPYLDSLRENIIICGSLDENFGKTLCEESVTLLNNYQLTLVGMPTWDNIKEILKPEYKNLPLIYSSSFFNPGQDAWSTQFTKTYGKMTFSRPTDMAYKGYEVTYYFSRLLAKYDSSLLSNLNDRSFRLLTEFEFKPIFWSKTSTTPDYYENKRVYMVKRINGMLLRVN